MHNADEFFPQDDADREAANEVFRFDFDGPEGTGTWGGGTLGNDREATLGGGDSGGPSFVREIIGDKEVNVIVGVNTFTQGFFGPYFGTLGGGINVYPYVEWIGAVLAGTDGGDGGGGGNPGKGKGNGKNTTTEFLASVVFERVSKRLRAGELGPGSEAIVSMRVTLHESHVAWASYEAKL